MQKGESVFRNVQRKWRGKRERKRAALKDKLKTRRKELIEELRNSLGFRKIVSSLKV
jgi:hypothetical protein